MHDERPGQSPNRFSLATWLTLAAGALFVLAYLVVFKPRLALNEATQRAGVGEQLRILELQPLTGTKTGISRDDLAGKVALVNFWGTWCPPCVVEFPHMVELWDRYRGRDDFAFVSVSSTFEDHENVEAVRELTAGFLARHETAMPTYIDADGVTRQMLADSMGLSGLGYPTTILIDRGGIIRAIWTGFRSGDERSMETMVSKLLNEPREPPAAAGG